MDLKLIKQGAEARLYLTKFNEKDCIVKERFIKKYRHPDLDYQITRERMKAESKTVQRCSSIGVRTPKIYHMDLNEKKLYIEYFPNSKTAKEYINEISENIQNENELQNKLNILCEKIGYAVGKMHSNNIIHGDLTTSNILINNTDLTIKEENTNNEYELIMIDFGLSHYSQSLEDKGVDLYVLERALLSTHSKLTDLFPNILKSYEKNYEKCKDVILKFEEVRARGRKRTMIG